jgi:hypothetical protein
MTSLRGLGFLLLAGILLFSVSLSGVAQQPTQSEQQDPAAQTEYSTTAQENAGAPAAAEHSISVPDNYQGASESQAAASGNEQQGYPAGAAPVLGHPLDPADVDTLTGKNEQRRQVGPVGGSYYGYPMSSDWFGTPQFGTRFFSGAGTQFFNPLLFGGINPFLTRGFGRGRNFGQNSFVFAPSPLTPFFLGGPHFATPGVVFTPGRNWNFAPPQATRFTGSRSVPHHRP